MSKLRFLTENEDFRKLEAGTKIHSIINGNIRHYIYVGENPKATNGYFICLLSGDYTMPIMIKPFPSAVKEVWIEGYDSKEVGEIMISQLKDQIESVREIYIEK